MSKVLVDRELLPCPFCGQQEAFVEQLDSDASVVICQGMVDEHSACLARGPVGVQQSDMEDQPGKDAAIAAWNDRAQPAEAEGVDFGVDDRSVKVSQEAYSIFLARERHHLAALSAVTAERDRLESMLIRTATRHFAQQWKGRADDKKLDECLSEGIAMLEAERDQLRAEVEASRLLLEQCNEVIAEDGGVYIELRAFLAGTMPASDVIALLRDSAMSAKEA